MELSPRVRGGARETFLLAALATFVILFPSLVVTGGLLGYFIRLLAPALLLPPLYSHGYIWAGHTVLLNLNTTPISLGVAAVLYVGGVVRHFSWKVGDALCLVAGVISAPIGVIAFYIAWKDAGRAKSANVPPV
ncbi:MAG TPA: hypothetical protein VGR51_06365 [Thermoplasmata archaeon]|nr:hypothetical protein [Thermoplasmata archaeon]